MADKSKLWYLENLNLMEGLSADEMMKLANMTNMKSLGKNEIIYFPDEPSSSFYFLKSGQVKLSRISKEGKEITLTVLGPGEIFGEFGLSESGTRDDIATAIDEVVICAVSKNQIENLLLLNPKLNLRIIKLIGLRLQKIERKLESLVFRDSNHRIIDFLSSYAGEYGKKIGTEIFIKTNITHQEIANLTATSRQTVTTVFNELKKQNIIDFSRREIIIRDAEKLKRA